MTDRKPKAIAEIARAACIGCEQCLPVCPVDAIDMDAEGIAVVDAEACTGCRKCVKACPAFAEHRFQCLILWLCRQLLARHYQTIPWKTSTPRRSR